MLRWTLVGVAAAALALTTAACGGESDGAAVVTVTTPSAAAAADAAPRTATDAAPPDAEANPNEITPLVSEEFLDYVAEWTRDDVNDTMMKRGGEEYQKIGDLDRSPGLGRPWRPGVEFVCWAPFVDTEMADLYGGVKLHMTLTDGSWIYVTEPVV